MTSEQASGRVRLLDLALTAFPRRWRETNEEELRHVHDAMGGSTSVRELADLAVGGVRVRLADRPPPRVWADYALMNKPLPPRWHGWMHDHLTSRWYPLTSGLPMMTLMLLMFIGSDALTGTPMSPWTVLAYLVATTLGVLTGSRWKRPKMQRQISSKIGYDIATDAWRTTASRTPVTPAPWFLPTPTTRMAIDLYGRPLGFWLCASGLALMAGAARPNRLAPDYDSPTFMLTNDLSSPLGGTQVVFAFMVTLMAATALCSAWRWWLVRQSERLSPTSVHPLNAQLSARAFWVITTLPGACVFGIGLAGLLPDRASVSVGAVLFLLGSLMLTADHVARRTVGRPVSMADLLVGERVVPLPPPPMAHDRVA